MSIFIHSVVISGLYALIAVGFTMIFGIRRVLNLTYGVYIMIAGYVYFSVVQQLGFPTGLGFIVAISTSVGLSILTYYALIKRFLADPTAVFISTLLFALVLHSVIRLIYTPCPRNVWPVVAGTTQVLGITIGNNILLALILSWVTMGSLLFFIGRTHIGRAIRATSMDRKGALISGIEPGRVDLVTFIWSGALAGVAGVFYASYTHLIPEMWIFLLVMAFAVVITGGIGSIPGAMIAAYIIGFAETITTMMIDARLSGAAAFAVMIAIIVLRPRGMFGREI